MWSIVESLRNKMKIFLPKKKQKKKAYHETSKEINR